MKYYFAPMEGITTFQYRRLHYKYFQGVEKYFTPFISPTMHGSFTPKERKDILPEHNEGIPVVPQILANNADYFLAVTKELKAYGYQEVNLNLGCPSNKVANKHKGSGFLSEPFRLERFLNDIFEKSVLPISIKTRIGRYDEDEWEELLSVFNLYPVKELIVHPRVQKDYYKEPVHMDLFLQTWKDSKNPVVYNGDINSRQDIERIEEQCPKLEALMLGRGLLSRPDLLDPRVSESTLEETLGNQQAFWHFHDELEQAYYEEQGNNTLYKMKELWIYQEKAFSNVDKQMKKIRKAKNREEYSLAIEELKAM